MAADAVVALCPDGCTSTQDVGGQAVFSLAGVPSSPCPCHCALLQTQICSPGLLRQISCLWRRNLLPFMFDTGELRILAYLGSAFHPDLISFAFTFSGMNITFISVSSFTHYFFFCTFLYSVPHSCLPASTHLLFYVSYRAALSQPSSLVD